jgi:carboxypeptidase Taq
VNTNLPTALLDLESHLRETTLLSSTRGLLEWDERTKMPLQGGPYRAEQIALLSGMIHQRASDARIGDWLGELEQLPLAEDRHSLHGCLVQQTRRNYEKAIKLPKSLVEEITRTTVLGQQSWVEAREHDDFAAFAPILEKIVGLKIQQAEALGYDATPYDALLDEYEPGETTSNVTRILADLREQLVPLVAAITDSANQPDSSILTRGYAADQQQQFGSRVAGLVGFDFQRGRLDTTHHPFCTDLGPHDCRITTRYDEGFFPAAFFGILHEAGHGFYELGMPDDWYGLPPGSCTSLGIHESQSRFWENMVGRGRPFWQWCLPLAAEAFPESFADLSVDQVYFAVNSVKPSLIRVEADEVTYNLHIIIRFELEQELISGQLAVSDLPDAWREKYEQYLGITPPNDADGVLQDIHWSGGMFGYFPTYALGNLYAAQFLAAMRAELGNMDQLVEQGDFQPLHDWLAKHIHQHAQRYSAAELVERATGEGLSHLPLVDYLREKLAPLYQLPASSS